VTTVIEFGVDVVDPGGEPTFRLRGTLDESGAAALEDAVLRMLDEAPERDLVIDCGDLTAIDYTGLGVLVLASNRLTSRGRAVHLRDVQPDVMDLIQRCGLGQVLDARPAQPPD
jgi:anti-anti-sigma factor